MKPYQKSSEDLDKQLTTAEDEKMFLKTSPNTHI